MTETKRMRPLTEQMKWRIYNAGCAHFEGKTGPMSLESSFLSTPNGLLAPGLAARGLAEMHEYGPSKYCDTDKWPRLTEDGVKLSEKMLRGAPPEGICVCRLHPLKPCQGHQG